MKIKYAIFDVGGVCYPYTLAPLSQYFRNKTSDKNAFDTQNAVKSFDYNPFMLGQIDFTQFCQDLCNHFNISYSPNIEPEINAAMHAGVGPFFAETLTAINNLKQHNITICLLSNALPNLAKTANTLANDDNIFVSYKLGLLKPNPQIYQKVLQKLNAKPAETIFIDDKPKNVEAANLLGINGIIFNRQTIIDEINKLICSD